MVNSASTMCSERRQISTAGHSSVAMRCALRLSGAMVPLLLLAVPSVGATTDKEYMIAYRQVCLPNSNTKGVPKLNITIVPDPRICDGGKGTFFPVPGTGEEDWPTALKAIIYLVGMFYTFAGVAIMADAFMGGIEAITSSETTRENEFGVQYKTKNWNPTVANLTLMALGSSAPEIILSLIEIISNDFYAGELGPGTIVGSAAFNLMFILGICIMAIPIASKDTEAGAPVPGIRRIKETGVYGITAVCSVWAYIWLILILVGWTPSVITIEEAVITFLFFPLLTVIAWMADRNYFSCGVKQIDPESIEYQEINQEERKKAKLASRKHKTSRASVIKKVKEKHGGTKSELLSQDPAEMARKLGDDKPQMSRAAYRKIGTKAATGHATGGNNAKVGRLIAPSPISEREITDVESTVLGRCDISVEHRHYSRMENCGELDVKIIRRGELDEEVSVDIAAVGSCTHRFKLDQKKVVFAPDEKQKSVVITIMPTSSRRRLSLAETGSSGSMKIQYDDEFKLVLSNPSISADSAATMTTRHPETKITIVEMNSAGYLTMSSEEVFVAESSGWVTVKVVRVGGGRGQAACSYRTKDKTAYAVDPSSPNGRGDYVAAEGQLVFEEGELEKTVDVQILDDDVPENDETFIFEIFGATGGAKIGDHQVCTITIENDDDIKNHFDKIAALLNFNRDKWNLNMGSWREQFHDAVKLPHGAPLPGHTEDNPKYAGASCMAYIGHFLMLFWKVIGASIPPPRIGGGAPCFFVALGYIGMVTALIGDLASLFGCTVGLSDQVTAITLVALGTSLPDTFASKMAAVCDKTADAAVTNVTGSNSVNVFLGLGVSWLVGACYWSGNSNGKWAYTIGVTNGACGVVKDYPGGAFYVKPGSLVFSVMLFCGCALVTFAVLAYRRAKNGGELGGPGKDTFGVALMLLWLAYVTMSCLQAEKVL